MFGHVRKDVIHNEHIKGTYNEHIKQLLMLLFLLLILGSLAFHFHFKDFYDILPCL